MMFELEEMGRAHRRSGTPSASQNGTVTRDITTDAGGVSHIEQNDNHSSHSNALSSVLELTAVVSPATRTRPKVDNATVKRNLRSMDLFMITINGTLGTGLYMRSGQIIQLAGPVAVVSSFIVLGLLVWAVMQCMTELLCLWPVPGALPLFVRKFVDQELGIAVGVTYWFTYSVGFGALIASAASILNYWTHNIPAITVGIIYVTLPIVLVCINMLEIGRYGLFEAITGTLKIFFLILILLGLLVTYAREPISENTKSSWESDPEYDEQAATGYFSAMMMCFSIATFAYTGVEIIAASAIEARWPRSSTVNGQIEQGSSARPTEDETPRNPHSTTSNPEESETTDQSFRDWPCVKNIIKFTAGYGPLFVAVVYTLSGLIVSLGLYQGHKELNKLSWIKDEPCVENKQTNQTCERTKEEDWVTSLSPFIIVARASGIPGLDHVFNAFIVFTALTCANTNLYVASRTLFGMARNVHDTHWVLRCFSYFGKTNDQFVPLRAVIISALAFCWVPLLQIPDDFHSSDSLGAYVETFAQMGSVSVVIVWACQCLAYIRFYNCIKKHEAALEQEGIYLRQQQQGKSSNYPFRSYLQPFVAYVAFCGCLIILVVCNGAFLWKGFFTFPFLSAYLTLIVFLAIWLILKACKGFPRGLSFFVDLDEETTIKAIRELNQARIQSMEPVQLREGEGTVRDN